jgi:hypothetical protein
MCNKGTQSLELVCCYKHVYFNPFVPRSTLLGQFYDFPFSCHRINPKGSILCSFLFVNFGANFFQKSRQ